MDGEAGSRHWGAGGYTVGNTQKYKEGQHQTVAEAAPLCFKQALPKMCHSPNVEDGVEKQLCTSETNIFVFFSF